MTPGDHISRARDAVDAAMGHLAAAHDAHEADNPRGVRDAHSDLRRCLRKAQDCFRAIAADQQVNGKTKIIATSNGVDESGGSANGRAGRSPLMTGDLKGWLDRARAGSGR